MKTGIYYKIIVQLKILQNFYKVAQKQRKEATTKRGSVEREPNRKQMYL